MLTKLKFLTSGESHGKGLLGILDGIPAGLELSKEYIDKQLARRQKGYGRGGRMKIEKDQAEIWGGIRHGKTLGSPVGLLITNKDWENWKSKMSIEATKNEIKKVVEAADGNCVKVIIETSLLNQDEKALACNTIMESGAAFVKTSTGFSSSGATLEDVRLIKKVVGDRVGIKASGGIKTKNEALKLIEAGATRIGTSRGVEIIL